VAIYKGLNGKVYKTTDKPFAGGGEGAIYDISGNPDIVAKIFRVDKRTAERERKLSIMVGIKPPHIEQYSWPLDMLYENGKFAGYIMRKIVGKENLTSIYVYENRKGSPWTLYIAIAKNLSSAVYNFHKLGQVIGDLNPQNVLVNPNTGLVTLVDTDSYHITDVKSRVYRCEVGMPEYVAPELQGKHLPSALLPTFTKETDLFSLAVLIFSLLMNGAHPFACRTIGVSSSGFQPVDNIVNGINPYFMGTRSANIDIPPYAPALDSLPNELQHLFKRAFIHGPKNPGSRPTAEEYYYVLKRLEKNENIRVCGANSEHLYYSHAIECPWCKVEQKIRSIKQSPYITGRISQGPGPQTVTKYQPAPSAAARKNEWWKPFLGIAAGIILISMIVNGISGSNSNNYLPVQSASFNGSETITNPVDTAINEASEAFLPDGDYISASNIILSTLEQNPDETELLNTLNYYKSFEPIRLAEMNELMSEGGKITTYNIRQTDNLGTEYNPYDYVLADYHYGDHTFRLTERNRHTASQTYMIDGKFTNFYGTIVLLERTKNSDYVGLIRVIGDGTILFVQDGITQGFLPTDFNIDVTEVKQLVIEFEGYDHELGFLIVNSYLVNNYLGFNTNNYLPVVNNNIQSASFN